MKLRKIIECYESLACMKDKKLPINISLILSRNFKKLIPVMEDHDEKRNVLVKQYAKKDEKGELITKEDGTLTCTNLKAFTDEVNELLETNIEIEFDKISPETLPRLDEEQFDTLTVKEISIIDEFMLSE